MNQSKKTSLGIIVAIIGVALFSAKAIMVKIAYGYTISSEHLLLFRMLFALPFYVVIAIVYTPSSSPTEKITKKEYSWVLFFGFIGYYLASYFDFLGLQYIKASLERIILFIYPTLVLLISRIFLKKSITKQQVIAIGITYIGILITFSGEFMSDSSDLILGGSLIFISALTYATYLVGSGWLIPKLGVIRFTSYAMIISSLCVIFQYLIFDRTSLWEYPVEIYILGVSMAIFSTIIPSYLISWAIKKLGASNVAILGSLGPISTIMLAFLFLNERLLIVQMIGAGIVILGVYFSSKKK